MVGNNAYNVYKNNSINYSSKEQLLLMLLDGAVRFSKIAKQAIVDKDIKKSNEFILKTEDIFYELIVTLDVDKAGDWGRNMISIYEFIIKRLIDANINKDINIIDEVIPIVEDIRDIWNEAYSLSKNVR